MEPPEFRQFDIIKSLEEEQCPNDSRRATRTLEAALEVQSELFCNAAGEPLVRVPGERQGQVWPLRSPRVRHWLAVLCWETIKHTKIGSRVRLEKVTIEELTDSQTGDSQRRESQPSEPNRSRVRPEKVTLAGDGDDENPRPSPGPSPLKPKPDMMLPKGDAGDGQKRAGQKRPGQTNGPDKNADWRDLFRAHHPPPTTHHQKGDADWRDLFRAHGRTDPPANAGNDPGSRRPGCAPPAGLAGPQALPELSMLVLGGLGLFGLLALARGNRRVSRR